MRVRPPHTVVAYATIVGTIVVVSLVREGAHQGLVLGGSVWALLHGTLLASLLSRPTRRYTRRARPHLLTE
jgi:hypothetical protein